MVRRADAGFTLVELLVGILILAVGVLAAAAAGTAALRVERLAEERERAVLGVELLLDSLLAEPALTTGAVRIGASVASWAPVAGGGVAVRVATPAGRDSVRWTLMAKREPDLGRLVR
ncbi:MAG: prepilin-type N-terminal cleavage/methylation domain-containing protein [Longimicrobiales bacterium]